MKGGLAAAAAAAMVGSASALSHHRHAHELFARRGDDIASVCVPGCTTIWTTITGEPTLVPEPKTSSAPPPPAFTPLAVPESPKAPETPKTTETPAPVAPTSTKVVVLVPTPEVHDCPTPGTYTFPATTITVSETTTVCAAETTKVPAGTYTVGGVTTVVETATTVTCPVAKVTTTDGVTTSIIEVTQYVCPTPGTYTIEPITTTVTEETVLVYPTPASYAPGIYTAPEQVVTVTETGYVYVCPYTSEGLPTTTSQAPAPPQETTQAPAPVLTTEKKETTTQAPPQETTQAPASTTQETTSEAPKSTKVPSTGGSLQGSNDHYGITYTPYKSSNGECKTSSEVDSDIKSLKESGFTITRSYSTDCDTLANVGGACKKYGMDMIIGVFVKGTGCSYDSPDIKEQVDAIAEWAQWDLVKLFVVGNEAIMNGFCTAPELRALVTVVKEKCSGYTGPYTIAETLNIWQREEVSSAICGVVDVTGANIHPYFNSEVTSAKAGEFVAGQIELLQNICPGNQAINLECGWPTRGNCNGAACPGKSEQVEAIQSIREAAGDVTVFFSYEDDMWKEPGSCGCEQSWGSKDCFLS